MRRVLLLALALSVAACSENPVEPVNRPPSIVQLIVMPLVLTKGGSTRATAIVQDPDGDPVTTRWTAVEGTLTDSTGTSTGWVAPDRSGVFSLVFEASDGLLSAVDSVHVTVGDASVAVFSDPPGSRVFVDGTLAPETTPVFVSPLAPGFHTIRVVNDFYVFADDVVELEVADGDADTVRFAAAPARSVVLDLGRDDFLEIGGITFLANGFGFLYAARTAEGTGLFSSSLNPPGQEASGVLLASGVSLGEPVAVSGDGTRVVYVDDAGRLVSATLSDPENNGIVNAIGDPRILGTGYGPALSEGGDFLFTNDPSSSEAVNPVFWAFFEDTTLGPAQLAATRPGRLPTLEPDGNRLAFEDGGTIYANVLGAAASLVLADGEYLTAPAWSRWGAGHVAMLSGEGPSALQDVVLVAPGDPHVVRIHEGLSDPRFAAWSPVQRSLVVTHNPGGRGEAVLLTGFPIR